jgi:hypothetical protein
MMLADQSRVRPCAVRDAHYTTSWSERRFSDAGSPRRVVGSVLTAFENLQNKRPSLRSKKCTRSISSLVVARNHCWTTVSFEIARGGQYNVHFDTNDSARFHADLRPPLACNCSDGSSAHYRVTGVRYRLPPPCLLRCAGGQSIIYRLIETKRP